MKNTLDFFALLVAWHRSRSQAYWGEKLIILDSKTYS